MPEPAKPNQQFEQRINKTPFDLQDMLLLKGMAILAIVFHNFYHRIGVVKENELAFDPKHFPVFLTHMFQPTEVFQAVFSYLGHFGVQIFIFLSAYGLALKYYPFELPWMSFVWSRLKKIYPMYLLALLLWLAWLAARLGPSQMMATVTANALKLIFTPLAVVNWIPHLGLPPVGPWWFLPFIIQFYCVWFLFAKFSQKIALKGLAALAGASLVFATVLRPILFTHWEINLQLSPLGHMAEICLGIAIARFEFRLNVRHVVCAAALFIVGNLYEEIWLVTFVSALAMALFVYQTARPVIRRMALFSWIGAIAMPVFFVNGIVRLPFLEIAMGHVDQWFVILPLGLLSAALSLGIGALLFLLERKIRTHFSHNQTLSGSHQVDQISAPVS